MIPYVALALLLNIAAIYAERLDGRWQRRLYIALGCVLCGFILLRDFHVCLDFNGYEDLYYKVPSMETLFNSFLEYVEAIRTDLSFSVLCSFLKTTGNSEQTNFIIIFSLYAILGVSLKLVGIRKLSSLTFQVLFLYFCKLYLLNELTQIRIGVAIGLIFIAIYFLQKEKYWQFAGLVALAAFFHLSALMMFILPLFKRWEANAKVWGVLFLLCVISNVCDFNILNLTKFIHNDFYQYKLASYMLYQRQTNYELNYLSVYFLLQNAVIILCFVFRKEMEADPPYLNILLNMCCLSSCCFVFFGPLATVAMRISEVFNCTIIFLIPHIARILGRKITTAICDRKVAIGKWTGNCDERAGQWSRCLSMAMVFTIGWVLFYIYAFHCVLILDYKTLWQ